MSDAWEPGKWYIEPADHDGCVVIESVERSIAHHVRPEDAQEIVNAHNNALAAEGEAARVRAFFDQPFLAGIVERRRGGVALRGDVTELLGWLADADAALAAAPDGRGGEART